MKQTLQSQDLCLRLPQIGECVNLCAVPELLPAFRSVLHGWQVAVEPHLDATAKLTVTRERNRYDWKQTNGLTAAKLEGLPKNPSDVTADFHYLLYEWFASAHPQLLCMHAAAVRLGQRAVIFPNTARAGKSTLSSALVAAGHESFGDDVVPFDTCTGEVVSTGLRPRLRLPLPQGAMTNQCYSFIRSRQHLATSSHTFLSLGPGELAAHGKRCKVKAVVTLVRQEKYVKARLEPASAADSLRALIEQNFSDQIKIELIFNGLKALVMSCRNFKLHFSRIDEAVSVLEEKLGDAHDEE